MEPKATIFSITMTIIIDKFICRKNGDISINFVARYQIRRTLNDESNNKFFPSIVSLATKIDNRGQRYLLSWLCILAICKNGFLDSRIVICMLRIAVKRCAPQLFQCKIVTHDCMNIF